MFEGKGSNARLAGILAHFGTLGYGLLRALQTSIDPSAFPSGYKSLMLSVTVCCLLAVAQIALRGRPRALAVTTGLITVVVFGLGTTLFDGPRYFFIAMFAIVGIVCLFRDVTALIIFSCGLLAVVAVVFAAAYVRDPALMVEMVVDLGLCAFGISFLILLLRGVTKKETLDNNAMKAFGSLLSATPNVTVVTDRLNNVLYISDTLVRLAGLSDRKYAIGRSLLDLFDNKGLKLLFADVMNAKGFYSSVRPITMGGTERYFKVVGSKLQAGSQGAFIDIADITETVQAQQEAESARKTAVLANKSKSDFLATMSHEIRTPINGVLGIAQIHLIRPETPPLYRTAFEKIYASGNILLGIINDILDLSKIETGKFTIQPVNYDAPSLINDTVQLNIVRLASKPIEFTVRVDEDVPSRLIGDELRVKQVLNNVLSNAFKYTDAGSVRLAISAEPAADGFTVVFRVSDTGQGIAQENIGKLFDEYSRFNMAANRETEGTGLGMSITHRLLELMGGRVEVESELGKGSVFTIYIPQRAVEGAPSIGKELAERLNSLKFTSDAERRGTLKARRVLKHARALVVDDIETNLHVAEGLLSFYHMRVETAGSGFEALDRIRGGETYDIVFMDHMMPEMDGAQTVEHMRGMGYTGAVIALTANAIAGSAEMFRESGFDGFLSKPINVMELDDALTAFIPDGEADGEAGGVLDPDADDGAALLPKLTAAFLRDVEKYAPILRAGAADNMKLFTTTVHAMKSACAAVRAEALSEEARLLEEAGRNNDAAYVNANAAGFAARLTAFAEGLGERPKTYEDAAEDAAYIGRGMARLMDACDEYDEAAVMALLADMRGKPLRLATRALLDEIERLVLITEFEEAGEIASEYLQTGYEGV